MTRRDFAKASIAAASAVSAPSQAPAQPALPKARWIENGIIDAGGSHEPYSFVIRRGGQRLDARQRYDAEQSEGVLRRLKEQGVEVFHTHFYKGAGMAHEREEMEDTRRVAAIAHKLGLKVDVYLQWNTMLYETFFAEEPRAQEWIQRDASGKPVMLTYGYQQSFRYRPCFANPDYLAYLGKLVRFAADEVKADFIHFDNFDLNAEPDSCHCRHCVAGFRQFLRTKYSPARRRERFGFENVDYVNPPQWNTQNPPQRMEIIFDPAIQEWIDFRCQTMSDALYKMASIAKASNPEVVIEVNPHGITGGNRAWEAGLDHARFLKHTQVFWTEERNQPAWLPDGRLVSTIRSYKLARAFGQVLFTYTSNQESAIAECLAFNQTIGFAGTDPLSAPMRKYIGFYREHRDIYTGTEDAGNVALLRSYASIAYHQARAQLGAILVEQALIQSKIPFDLIFDEHLLNLAKYRVLILPESQCLSDEQLAHARRFVENGGGLIATGQTGLYDAWRRLRSTPGLAGLVDSQRPARAYQERVEREEGGGRPVVKRVGKGQVAYFPEVVFDGPQPELGNNFAVLNRYWKAPKNWLEIASAVRAAAGGELPVEVGGPAYLVANLVRQTGKRRVLLHLVNYNAAAPSTGPVEISCRLPEGAAPKKAMLYSPDMPSPQPVATTSGKSIVKFTVQSVKVYTVAALEY
jgi:hypothetical protein